LDAQGLESTFLYGDGSGVEKLLTDHLGVVSLEELNYPLTDTFIFGILELNVELDIPLNVEAFIRPPPLAPYFPFCLALEEIEVISFRLNDYYGEEFPVLGIASLPNRLIVEEGIQLVLYRLDWHPLRLWADFAWAHCHGSIIVTEVAK